MIFLCYRWRFKNDFLKKLLQYFVFLIIFFSFLLFLSVWFASSWCFVLSSFINWFFSFLSWGDLKMFCMFLKGVFRNKLFCVCVGVIRQQRWRIYAELSVVVFWTAWPSFCFWIMSLVFFSVFGMWRKKENCKILIKLNFNRNDWLWKVRFIKAFSNDKSCPRLQINGVRK